MNNALVPQDQPRSSFIGGSDVAAVLGLSKYQTPYELWLEKTGQAPKREFTAQEARRLRRGKKLEPHILDLFLEENPHIKIVTRGARYCDHELTFLAAEIDFEWIDTRDPDAEIRNGEIKSVDGFARNEWGEIDTDEVPIHYAAQAMHGLAVTGRNHCIVIGMFGMDNLVPYHIFRDADTIAQMRAQCVVFWRDYVAAKMPPPPVNMDDITLLLAKANGTPVKADEEMERLIEELRIVSGQASKIDAQREALKFGICLKIAAEWKLADPKNATDDAVIVGRNGETLATWKKQSRESIDQDRLRKEQPKIAADYTRETFFRVIRPTTKKGKK